MNKRTCLCELINSGQADGSIPQVACPEHPRNKSVKASFVEVGDACFVRLFDWHSRHPFAVYFWGVLTGLLVWLKFR